MRLVQQTIIKKSNSNYKQLEHLCHLSKNLYNAALYAIRQQYQIDKSYLNYYAVNSLFKKTNNPDYNALQKAQSQQTLKMIDQEYRSFFKSIKSLKINHPVHLPHYLKKDGLYPLICPLNGLSISLLKNGIIRPGKTKMNIRFSKINPNTIQQVRFIPKTSYIVMEIVYAVTAKEKLSDNGKYMALDLGVKNFVACTSTVDRPFLINGRSLLSMNHYYNKHLSHYKIKLEKTNNRKTSKRIQKLTSKRNNKVKDYIHNISRYLIDYAVDRQINTIIIGKNDGWKQDTNIGKVNNQNFNQFPHAKFITMLQYKAELAGITVITINESYTSKCSFFDNEKICYHDTYVGKRTTTKLFRTNSGKLINADVNGSYNIMSRGLKKLHVSNDVARNCEPVCNGLVVNPLKITFINRKNCKII